MQNWFDIVIIIIYESCNDQNSQLVITCFKYSLKLAILIMWGKSIAYL